MEPVPNKPTNEGLRVRHSLQEIDYKYRYLNDKKPLETLIRAFRGVSLKKPNYDVAPHEDKSFFRIAGFHGEPFEGPGKFYGDWWGGYCHHNDVLFPTWHRAYLLHLENALREVEGCEDVTLPFWDELMDVLDGQTKDKKPIIPEILTTPKFSLDGKEIDNPLFSYELTCSLAELVAGTEHRYSKEVGYKTVRYPLSGLVGTEEDRKATELHNAKFGGHDECAKILNENVYAWLNTGVVIGKKGDGANMQYPDTSSVKHRYLACFKNSEYTPFSNKISMQQHLQGYKGPVPPASIEDPHNAIHLAVGGFYQKDNYKANPKVGAGANGDMGNNQTAGFDPIFFFHHCFIDYVFWLWQEKFGLTEMGSLKIDSNSRGAFSKEGSVGFAPGTSLNENSYLVPFRNPSFKEKDDVSIENSPWLTTRLVTNISSQLGYTYGIGSLTNLPDVLPAVGAKDPQDALLGASDPNHFSMISTDPINRADYSGSFIIRTMAVLPSQRKIQISRDAILSRYDLESCANCQTRMDTRAITAINKELVDALMQGEKEEDKDKEIVYRVEIIHRDVEQGTNVKKSLFAGEQPMYFHPY